MDFKIVATEVDKAVMVAVIAFLIVGVDATLIVKEIRWNADSVRTTITFSTTVPMFLAIARCIEATDVLVADKSLIGSLTKVITEVLK